MSESNRTAITDIGQRLWAQYEIHRGDIPEMADLFLDARNEIDCLRTVVRAMDAMPNSPRSQMWMHGSPADEAFNRALSNGSTRGGDA